jgi:hypothetical protein
VRNGATASDRRTIAGVTYADGATVSVADSLADELVGVIAERFALRGQSADGDAGRAPGSVAAG